MTRFVEWLSRKTGRCFTDYESLHSWSVENLEDFWGAYLDFSGLEIRSGFSTVLAERKMPGANWFPGMTLNYAENLIGKGGSETAIVFQVEGGSVLNGLDTPVATISRDQLRKEVTRCAAALRARGLGPGDRVAGYLANVPEAIIACLACASLGITWSSASPDFGIEALSDRLGQVRPKLIFTSTHYRYNGRTFRTSEVVKGLRSRLPGLEGVISIPYPVDEPGAIIGDLWEDFLGEASVEDLVCDPVPFQHPLFVLFSSGTTGKPKCMVHGAGGTLLQHHKELFLHCNLKPCSRLLFFTTCGWMMWNWQLSALATGAAVCLYDGNPGYPDLNGIWEAVDNLEVTHFGTSGRFLESCMKNQPPLNLHQTREFRHLETILYTGSPLSAGGFRWVYEGVKPDVHLAGISGGTDIVSCFVLGNPNLPVREGEIQCKGLGVDAAAFDEDGQEAVGRPGELVCRKPIPSMPVEFLDDPTGEKYRKAYFDSFPGVWCHGDFVEFTSNGGVIIFGRSDATLNPGGVRIGSSEIYSALDAIPEITGAIVVGWIPPGWADEVIVLCTVLAGDSVLAPDLISRIRDTIRRACSPRHVPHHVFSIPAVPVTRSGKPVELSVKAVLAGHKVANRDALANPELLDVFEQIRTILIDQYG